MPDTPGARPPAAPQGRVVRVSSRREELVGDRLPFIKPEQLANAGPFQIQGYDRRRNRRFAREECRFSIMVEGTGELGLLTLEANDRREALGRIFRGLRPGQVLGHLVLLKTETGDGTFFWEFAELDDAGNVVRFEEDEDPVPDGGA